MDFAYTDHQLELSRRYREIGQRHARHSELAGFDWRAWRAVTEAGLWRLLLARPLEGRFDFTAAFDALTASQRSIGFAMAVANQATLIDCLQTMGTQAQRDRLLPRLLDGEPGATAISEGGTGTEIRALQTRLTDDGDGYRLDGDKYNISLAPHASLALVVARYEEAGHAHTALVMIDTKMPGVVRGEAQNTLGVRELPIGEFRFDAVRVEHTHLIGAPRDGLRVLMRIASMNRAYFALICANAAKPFLIDALAYAAGRKILDVAIDAHQHVQRRLVDIRMRAERSRWMALGALGQLLNNDPQALESCSIAKITAAQDLTQSALDLLALHGSDGYRSGSVATFVTDALAMISAGGTEEMHRKNVFAQMQRHRERTASATAAIAATQASSATPAPANKPAADRDLIDRPPTIAAQAAGG
jgi:isovaleryl-CoA dehydrogenase